MNGNWMLRIRACAVNYRIEFGSCALVILMAKSVEQVYYISPYFRLEMRRYEMLRQIAIESVPVETARVAQAAFPDGHRVNAACG